MAVPPREGEVQLIRLSGYVYGRLRGGSHSS